MVSWSPRSITGAALPRGYTQEQAIARYHQAGFTQLHVYHGFTFEPAVQEDMLFTIVGVRN